METPSVASHRLLMHRGPRKPATVESFFDAPRNVTPRCAATTNDRSQKSRRSTEAFASGFFFLPRNASRDQFHGRSYAPAAPRVINAHSVILEHSIERFSYSLPARGRGKLAVGPRSDLSKKQRTEDAVSLSGKLGIALFYGITVFRRLAMKRSLK